MEVGWPSRKGLKRKIRQNPRNKMGHAWTSQRWTIGKWRNRDQEKPLIGLKLACFRSVLSCLTHGRLSVVGVRQNSNWQLTGFDLITWWNSFLGAYNTIFSPKCGFNFQQNVSHINIMLFLNTSFHSQNCLQPFRNPLFYNYNQDH